MVHPHALRRLGVEHDAAVEVHVLRGVGHHLPGETILHPQDVTRIREVGEKMPILLVELRIAIIGHLDHAVLDPEGIGVILAEGMLGDLGRPPRQVLAVEQGVPLRLLRGDQSDEAGTDQGQEAAHAYD